MPRPDATPPLPGSAPVDLQPDVERLHRVIRREPHDPLEGRERVPWYFIVTIIFALFWGGWYLGRFGGEFAPVSHLAYSGRQVGIAAASAQQSAVAVSDPISAGRTVFENNCQSCHQASGLGIPGVFPPVVNSEWVTDDVPTLARILLHGMQGPIQVAGVAYNGAMPAWKDVLRDEEIAAVATYIRQLDSNDAPPVPVEEVAAVREADASRSAPWTATELQSAPAVAAPEQDAAESPGTPEPTGGSAS